MRNLFLALPVLASVSLLGACSAIEQPYVTEAPHASYGQYDQGCAAGTCAPGQGYSVAGGANPDHWPDAALVNGYESGGAYGHHAAYGHQSMGHQPNGPVHVNPTGYGPQGPVYGQGYGAPHLRGLRGPKRGNFYGTLGAVMYDTDIDSFGLEGRLGYEHNRPLFLGTKLGAEIEGSVGLIDEKDTVDDITTKGGFDYNVAGFAVARMPVSPRLSLHTRGGYDFRQLSVKATDELGGSAEVELDLDGFAYGIGAEYALSPRSGLRLDLTRYDNDFGASESISASYTRKF